MTKQWEKTVIVTGIRLAADTTIVSYDLNLNGLATTCHRKLSHNWEDPRDYPCWYFKLRWEWQYQQGDSGGWYYCALWLRGEKHVPCVRGDCHCSSDYVFPIHHCISCVTLQMFISEKEPMHWTNEDSKRKKFQRKVPKWTALWGSQRGKGSFPAIFAIRGPETIHTQAWTTDRNLTYRARLPPLKKIVTASKSLPCSRVTDLHCQ